MDMINKLKDLEEKYQVAMDWYYREKLYESEYKEKIGEYVNYTPDEIVNEICNLIKKL